MSTGSEWIRGSRQSPLLNKAISRAVASAKKPKMVSSLNPWIITAASVAVVLEFFFFNSNPSFDDYNQYENAYSER
jgi:hypothetical protein